VPVSQHRTQAAGSVEVTRLALRATAGGGCRVTGGGGAFRGVQQRLTRTAARVALVPDRALLLAGDHVALEVDVDPGLWLTLVETAGTVASDGRGGRASWSTVFRSGAGAPGVHERWPWVPAAGSDGTRALGVELGLGARALLRETRVLGRHGEEPGRLRTRSRVRREGA